MTKIDQLFIRACKSRYPEKRVLSVYRRFYIDFGGDIYNHLVQIFSRICDEHVLFKTIDLSNDLDPENKWKYGLERDTPYHRFCFRVLMSKIRLAEVSSLNGLSVAARFKKTQKA